MQQHKWKKIEIYACTSIFVLSYAFIALLFFAQWPNWWNWTVPEQSPMTWMQSLLLFLNALVALSLAIYAYLYDKKQNMRWWFLLSIGLMYLMLDERFAIHERIRDSYLAPQQIGIPIFPWIPAGDFLLPIYALVALCFLYPYLQLFKRRKAALLWLLVSFGLALIVVAIDSFSFKNYTIIIQNVQQFSEELVEVAMMNSIFTALFLTFSFHIQQTNTKRVE